MKREKIRRWCRNGFGLFLGLMAVFTVLSRILDTLTVPQVETGYSKTGSVNYEILGEGTFSPSQIAYVNPEQGLKVQSVEVTAGQKVKEGDVLFVYQMEGIQKKKEEMALSIEKMKLELEQLDVKARQIPGLSEEALAVQTLEAARRALAYGNQDLEELKRNSEEKLTRLKRDFNESMNRSEEEMEEETRRQYRAAERAYDAAEAKKESAVKKTEREVADCEEKLERLQEEGASEEEMAAAEKALERAGEDLEEVREEQERNVREARAALDNAEEDCGDVSAGRRSAAETLRNSYEASVEAIKEQIRAGERSVRDLEEAVVMAELGVENSRARDGKTAKEQEQEREAGRLQRQAQELDLVRAEKELARITELEAASGRVCAETEGVVAEVSVKPGKTVTGEEIVAIGDGRLAFSGTVEKKLGEFLKPGTKLELQYGESRKVYEAVVETVDYLSAGDRAGFTAAIGEDAGILGASASFRLGLQSGQYDQVIPIAALRQESDGYFVLITKSEKTILGEELVAEKVPVELLEKSSSQAAVRGAFTISDRLITSSTRIIEAGDRIRISGE